MRLMLRSGQKENWILVPLSHSQLFLSVKNSERLQSVLQLLFLLPTGAGYSDYTFRVPDGVVALQMRCSWPGELFQIDILHQMWLKSDGRGYTEVYHPKVLGFEAFSKDMRSRSSDGVEFSANITFPFPVEPHTYGHFSLYWRESTTKVVYVDLRAFVEAYAIVIENPTLEIS